MVKNPSGLMPFFRWEAWIQDSDKIAEYLDTHYAENTLKTPWNSGRLGVKSFQYLQVGSKARISAAPVEMNLWGSSYDLIASCITK